MAEAEAAPAPATEQQQQPPAEAPAAQEPTQSATAPAPEVTPAAPETTSAPPAAAQTQTQTPAPAPAQATASAPTAAPAARAKHAQDFIFGDTLGHGSFGDVVKAVDKETGTEYAIKIIDKQLVLKLNKQKYVVTERDILLACNHPNIVRLFYTFRSETALNYVMELCPGGELLSYIHKYKSFSINVTRFYVAETINALEHLHTKGIVHRDLKPENVLLSASMHTDFGTAKNLVKEAKEGKPRTNSFVGTNEFVPPEVLTAPSVADPSTADDKPLITTAADLWSLGCMVYQMLTGRYPFHGKSDMLTFERIKARDLYMPPNMPPEAADFINRLLVLAPEQRLGANCDFASLRAHPFFGGLKFDGLWKEQPPAFEPFPFPLDFSAVDNAAAASAGGAAAPSVAAAAAAAAAPTTAASPAAPDSPTSKQPLSAAAAAVAATTPSPTSSRFGDGTKQKSGELGVDEQATKEYEGFLKPGEDVLLARPVQRLYRLHTRRQILLLTSTPRIVLLSADDTPRFVKEIGWSMALSFGLLSDSSKFFIQVSRSKKKFKDLEHNAATVLSAFEQVMRRHRETAVPDQP